MEQCFAAYADVSQHLQEFDSCFMVNSRCSDLCQCKGCENQQNDNDDDLSYTYSSDDELGSDLRGFMVKFSCNKQ